jgi:branched-chain amino acid transport system permease protein
VIRLFDWVRPATERTIGFGVLVVAAIGPLLFSDYWVANILTYTFWLGIAAASLIFLSAYGGMVSLAQVSIYGIAGLTLGNLVGEGGTYGLNLGWNPSIGFLVAIAFATTIGLIFGALASRSTGIYFLMITLTYAVMTYYFFAQVNNFGGFGGINNINAHAPRLIGDPGSQPNRLYYVALIVALGVYFVIKYVARTPFGLAFQGIRDDPIRMASLGYNVPLHRTVAFTLAAFFAAVAGVLNVWWIGEIAPGTVDLTSTIELLIVAVIGGLYRIEGAWLGAFAFVLINNYTHNGANWFGVDFTFGGSFVTLIGAIFLAIIVVSPGGLFGMWDSGWDRMRRLIPQHRSSVEPPTPHPNAGGQGD